MLEIKIGEDFFTYKPMDDPGFDYRGTVVQGMDTRSPAFEESMKKVIAAKLEQMTREHGPGWAPYFLYIGGPRQRQTFIGPILFWRRHRVDVKNAS